MRAGNYIVPREGLRENSAEFDQDLTSLTCLEGDCAGHRDGVAGPALANRPEVFFGPEV